MLLQILSGATAANKLLPSGAIIPLVAGDTYEINIPDGFPVRDGCFSDWFALADSSSTAPLPSSRGTSKSAGGMTLSDLQSLYFSITSMWFEWLEVRPITSRIRSDATL